MCGYLQKISPKKSSSEVTRHYHIQVAVRKPCLGSCARRNFPHVLGFCGSVSTRTPSPACPCACCSIHLDCHRSSEHSIGHHRIGFQCVCADSFFHTVASPFHSLVTNAISDHRQRCLQELNVTVPTHDAGSSASGAPAVAPGGSVPVNETTLAVRPVCPAPAVAAHMLKPLSHLEEHLRPHQMLASRPRASDAPGHSHGPDTVTVASFAIAGVVTGCLVAVLCMARALLRRGGVLQEQEEAGMDRGLTRAGSGWTMSTVRSRLFQALTPANCMRRDLVLRQPYMMSHHRLTHRVVSHCMLTQQRMLTQRRMQTQQFMRNTPHVDFNVTVSETVNVNVGVSVNINVNVICWV